MHGNWPIPATRHSVSRPLRARCWSGRWLVVLLGAVLAAAPSRAATNLMWVFNTGFSNGGVIPDGNPSGWSDTRNVTLGAGLTIADLDVQLIVNGGWNGDLYAYLVHGSGFSVLLNRPGRTASNSYGYRDNILDVDFDDDAVNGDIHVYQNNVNYNLLIQNGSPWAPDARNVNPSVALDTDPRTVPLSGFNGLAPTGDWTLFVADLSGGGTSTVQSWGMEALLVPEPSTATLGLVFAGALWRLRRRQRPLRRRAG